MSLEQVREWALVLDAEDIPYHIAREPEGGWTLVVSPDDMARTAVALSAYHDENVPLATSAADPAPARVRGAPYLGLVLSALLAGFFVVTGPRMGDTEWFALGAADSAAFLDGEAWRAVTALTLHADGGHILSNALAGALFFGAVCGLLGPGIGLWLILLSGAGGNTINMWIRGPGYSGVGASTAVFGAVGILAGAQFARNRRPGLSRGRALLPVLAGLGLLLLLGSSPETDVLAHAFGFLVGVALGFAARRAIRRPLGSALQWSLAAAAVVAVVACWMRALA